MRLLIFIMIMVMEYVSAQAPIRVAHSHTSDTLPTGDTGGPHAFWWRATWAKNGTLIGIVPSRFTGSESFTVEDVDALKVDALNTGNLLWLYKGVVMRKGEDVKAKEAARDKELAECWKKRGNQVAFLSLWHQYGKVERDRRLKAWYDDPKAPHKEPGWYYGGVGAVSRDLKTCYFYEYDETRQPWRGGGRHEWDIPGVYKVLDLETGQRRPIPAWLDGREGNVLDVSPDNRWVLGWGREGPIVALAENFQTYRKFKFKWQSLEEFFCPNSKYLVVFSVSYVTVYDVEKGKAVCDLDRSDWRRGGWFGAKPEYRIDDVMFSPDSRYLWVYGGHFGDANRWAQNGRACLVWDIAQNRMVKSLTEEQVARVEGFGPISETVILGAKDRLQLVHIGSGQVLADLLLPPGAPPRRYLMSFTPDKDHLHPWWITWKFQALSRADGLVVDGMEDVKRIKNAHYYVERDGVMHRVESDRKEEVPYITKRLVNWHLGPHMETLRARVAELERKR